MLRRGFFFLSRLDTIPSTLAGAKSKGDTIMRRLAILTVAIVVCGCASTENEWADYTDEQLNELLGERYFSPSCTPYAMCRTLYPPNIKQPQDAGANLRRVMSLQECEARSCEYYESQFEERQAAIKAEITRRHQARQHQEPKPAP